MMILLIDTGTWLKLELLQEKEFFDPVRLYDWATIQITHEVEEELNHFHCKSWIKNRTHIIPIGDQNIYEDMRDLEFDAADASILSNGKKNDLEYYVISEDRPLLDYAMSERIIAGLLGDFFKICAALDWISSCELYHLVKELYALKNITKHKRKEILMWRLKRQ